MKPVITLLLIGLGAVLQTGIESTDSQYWTVTTMVWLFIIMLNSILA